MRWIDRLASRWKYPEQRVWVLVVALAVVLATLAVATAARYTGVLVARTSVSLAAQESVAFAGTNATGALLDDGKATLHLTLTVSNPSSERVAFDAATYRSWIEDGPAEAGILNRTGDNVLSNATGVHHFFSAFSGTIDIEAPAIAAGTSTTVHLAAELTRVNNSAAFGVVQNITQYEAATRGSGSAAPWVHWILLVLRMADLPPPLPTSSQDLTNLARIVIEEGLNLAAA